jgi:hypothetical protein
MNARFGILFGLLLVAVRSASAVPSMNVTTSYKPARGGITWEVTVTKDAVADSADIELPLVLSGASPGFMTSLNNGGDATNGFANGTWYYNETAPGSGVLVWNIHGDAANESQNTGNNPFTGTITSGLQLDTANKRLFASLGSTTDLTSPVPTLHITSTDGTFTWTNAILTENSVQYLVSGHKSSVRVGDMNGDGKVSFGDFAPFAQGLTNPVTYSDMFPGLDRAARGDMSQNGAFNFGDLTAFGTCLTGNGCPPPPGAGAGASGFVGAGVVPEPASVVLAAVAVIAFAVWWRQISNRRNLLVQSSIGSAAII